MKIRPASPEPPEAFLKPRTIAGDDLARYGRMWWQQYTAEQLADVAALGELETDADQGVVASDG